MKITHSALLLSSDDSLEIADTDELAFSAPLSDEICKILLNTACPIIAQNLWDLLQSRGVRTLAIILMGSTFCTYHSSRHFIWRADPG